MGNVLGGCRKAVSSGVDLEEALKAFGGSFPHLTAPMAQADMSPLPAGVQDYVPLESHGVSEGNAPPHIDHFMQQALRPTRTKHHQPGFCRCRPLLEVVDTTTQADIVIVPAETQTCVSFVPRTRLEDGTPPVSGHDGTSGEAFANLEPFASTWHWLLPQHLDTTVKADTVSASIAGTQTCVPCSSGSCPEADALPITGTSGEAFLEPRIGSQLWHGTLP
jgi:hypothetical protein